jgi:hypothetical protein
MYRRGEAAEIESGVIDSLGPSAPPFADFARDYALVFA